VSLLNWRSQGVFAKADKQGNVRLTPEGIVALQPSTDAPQSVSAQTVAVEVQATMYLPSSQAITLTRQGANTVITSSMMVVNPGDIITLGSVQAIIFVPI
jgi:hypothetical protein